MSRLAFLLLFAICMYGQQPYDLVIAGGTVIDGSGSPGRRADVGIRGGRIASVGDLARAPRRVVLCALPALRVLPLSGDSPDDPRHARDGSGDQSAYVVD